MVFKTSAGTFLKFIKINEIVLYVNTRNCMFYHFCINKIYVLYAKQNFCMLNAHFTLLSLEKFYVYFCWSVTTKHLCKIKFNLKTLFILKIVFVLKEKVFLIHKLYFKSFLF